jgi:hypothetical protein
VGLPGINGQDILLFGYPGEDGLNPSLVTVWQLLIVHGRRHFIAEKAKELFFIGVGVVMKFQIAHQGMSRVFLHLFKEFDSIYVERRLGFKTQVIVGLIGAYFVLEKRYEFTI